MPLPLTDAEMDALAEKLLNAMIRRLARKANDTHDAAMAKVEEEMPPPEAFADVLARQRRAATRKKR